MEKRPAMTSREKDRAAVLDGQVLGGQVLGGEALSGTSLDGHAALSWRQERLLNCYFDGECGFWGRVRASRLLARRTAAREYFDSLQQLQLVEQKLLPMEFSVASRQCDVWDRISSRLDQEERDAILLGKRRIVLEPRRPLLSPTAEWWWAGALGLGLAGFLAFLNVGALFGGRSSGPESLSGEVADSGLRFGSDGELARQSAPVAEFSPVSLASETLGGERASAAARPIPLALNDGVRLDGGVRADVVEGSEVLANTGRGIPHPVMVADSSHHAPQLIELDWLRSQGRVKLLPGPSSGSAIIWVRRQKSSAHAGQNEPQAGPQPSGLGISPR